MFDFLKVNRDAKALKAALALHDCGKIKITWSIKASTLKVTGTLFPKVNKQPDDWKKEALLDLIFSMNARQLKRFIKFIRSSSMYDNNMINYLENFPENGLVYFVSCDIGPHVHDVHAFTITNNRRILLRWFFSDFSTDDEKLECFHKFCDIEGDKFINLIGGEDGYKE